VLRILDDPCRQVFYFSVTHITKTVGGQLFSLFLTLTHVNGDPLEGTPEFLSARIIVSTAHACH